MISILVYGRNDGRGYGMEKRVALSLNNMAQVLTGETSEILFVDYNTPDHLPTLPELIADTLTPRAKKYLRVFRVRPAAHARFADLTPLPVLEPVARNVALLRSCPRNRWIVSTNTDSIFVTQGRASLEDIVGGLEKANYGLPRFELPERAWEGFDRSDPAGVIESAATWGRVARLNEVVFGDGVVLFDGPGDFQLMPRATLFAIDGFDEDMLLGWHVDHNLAARLELALGPTRSLQEHCALYHCGHVRQPTQTHSHARLENDVSRFVTRLTMADCPRQRNNWGCPDDAIEEIDLLRPRSMQLRDVAGAIMPALGDTPLTAHFDRHSYENFWYDCGHAAAHVIDLLSSFSPDTRIGYAGVRRDLFRLLQEGMKRCGFSAPVMTPASLAGRLGLASPGLTSADPGRSAPALRGHGGPNVSIVDDAVFVELATLPIFEFGLTRDDGGALRDVRHGVVLADAESAALERVHQLFEQTAAAELVRLATGEQPRLFVTLNAIHNRYEDIVAKRLLAAPAPFSTRLRYGRLRIAADAEQAPDAYPGAFAAALAAAMGARAAPDGPAIRNARTLLRDIVSGAADDGGLDLEIAACAELIAALVQVGSQTRQATALPGAVQLKVAERLAIAVRPQVSTPLVARDGADGPPGLASLDAWADADWRRQMNKLGGEGRDAAKTNGWIWERGQILWLTSRLPAQSRRRALVVCEYPERLIGGLSDLCETVDVVDVRAIDGVSDIALKRLADFGVGPMRQGAAFDVAMTPLTPAAYDIIVAPHAAAFRQGVAGLGDVLGRLRPALAPGGSMIIAGEMATTGRLRHARPDAAMVAPSGLPHILGQNAALAQCAPMPEYVLDMDAALVGLQGDLDEGRPVLGVRREGDVLWPFVWLFKATADTFCPARLSLAIHTALTGEQLPAMHVGAGARHDDGLIVATPGESGHLMFGPFISLTPGDYYASIDAVFTVGGADAPRLVGEVSLDGIILIQQDAPAHWSGQFAHRFVMPFKVGSPASEPRKPCVCEVRLWSDGTFGAVIRSVRIDVA